METKDLRIGNLVYGISDRIETIVALTESTITSYPGTLKDSAMAFDKKDFKPIILTQEWLNKLGFEKTEDLGDIISYEIKGRNQKEDSVLSSITMSGFFTYMPEILIPS